MVMQVPSPRAHDGADDIETTTYGRLAAPAVLHFVRADRLPAPTVYSRYGDRAVDLAIAIPLLVMLILPMMCIGLALNPDSSGNQLFRQRCLGLWPPQLVQPPRRAAREGIGHEA
jgi:hypothetical protein